MSSRCPTSCFSISSRASRRRSPRGWRKTVADDVQVVDVAPHYGLLSVQGPQAESVVRAVGLFTEVPAQEFGFVKITDATLGEIYLMNQPRLDGGSRRREEADISTRTAAVRLPHVGGYER